MTDAAITFDQFTAEQLAQAGECRWAVLAVAVREHRKGLHPSLLLAAIGTACIEVFKAHQPHDVLPELLRREADRVERMLALDTAAARRVN